ncbi:MAG: SIS domain-containing protein [Actinomycetes bacterium]
MAEMNPAGFLGDVEATPVSLVRLADAIDRDLLGLDRLRLGDADRVLLLGMGSSAYAAGVVAARLRSLGVSAVAELASSALLPPATPGTLVLAVSASGGSAETLAATRQYAGRCRVVAVTDVPGSPVGEAADAVVGLLSGPEPGGVSCRSYRHTVAVLLAVAEQLAPGTAPGLAAHCRRAAESTATLLDARSQWLPDVARHLDGPLGCWVVGPAARLASAQQSALMLREGPRVPAHAAETGDWSHVDVYLTRTIDYRMLLLPGSAWDGELLRWTTERGSTVVSVGGPVAGGRYDVGYDGQDVPDVALLTETTVAELVAHRWWAAQQS